MEQLTPYMFFIKEHSYIPVPSIHASGVAKSCTYPAYIVHVSGVYHVCIRYISCMYPVYVMHVSSVYHECIRCISCMYPVQVMHVSGVYHVCIRCISCMYPVHIMHIAIQCVKSRLQKY